MEYNDFMSKRFRELQAQGLDLSSALARIDLEYRIEHLLPAYGDDLKIYIYGNFKPPKEDLHIPSLGITINRTKQEKTPIRTALCVLEASIKIDDKSVSGIIDAIRRINLFLGVFTLVKWGNGSIGWWSYFTHIFGHSLLVEIGDQNLDPIIDAFLELPAPVRKKVDAALYWLREPKNQLLESYKSDSLRIYSAYWNAFECLVDAINSIKAQPKLSKDEKQKRIDEFIRKRDGRLTIEDIDTCYKEIVNPGFKSPASHALEVCFPETDARRYINECFDLPEKYNRLYKIRNAIDHGDIDAENPGELIRIESRLDLLREIIWGIFRWIIQNASSFNKSNQQI